MRLVLHLNTHIYMYTTLNTYMYILHVRALLQIILTENFFKTSCKSPGTLLKLIVAILQISLYFEGTLKYAYVIFME